MTYLQQVIETGNPVSFLDQREHLIFETRFYPVLDDTGHVSRVAVFALDTTRRVQAEMALQKSQSLLNETQKLSHIGGWEWDVAAQTGSWTDERRFPCKPGQAIPCNISARPRVKDCTTAWMRPESGWIASCRDARSSTTKADLPPSGPVIRANIGQIQQVLTKLVTNAWEAACEKRTRIDLTVKTVFQTDIPVILSSGYDEAHVMAEEHPERPNAFLGKPYQFKWLSETISRVLAKTKK